MTGVRTLTRRPESRGRSPRACAAIRDRLLGGCPLQELTPGARAGLEPATLVVNAGSGCSAAVKPREAVIAEPVTCWDARRIT
jgi:hypothetical protein